MKTNFPKFYNIFLKIQNIFIRKDKVRAVRGIAMVESLMAITIVIISIMGPMAISLNAATYAKYGLHKVTASSLANEQIEMMVNYKKSLDIFCFNNPLNGDCNGEDGFNHFVNTLTDLSGINCPLASDGSGACYFDGTSFSYVTSALPAVTEKTSCKMILQTDDIAKCDGSYPVPAGDKSIFVRKLYIDNVDTMKATSGLGESLINTSLRLVSVVCINNDSCVPGDKRAITIISYIYR